MKPIPESTRQKNRDREKARYWANREAMCARRREHYRKDPEKHKAYSREYYRSNRDRLLELSAEWQAANPDKVREAKRKWRDSNPEKQRSATAQWAKEHPLEVRLKTNRRRSRKLNAPGFCSPQQAIDRIEFYGNKCAYCKSAPADHMDHVIPLARGGTNWPSNLRPSCGKCNSSKGSKLLSEWTPWFKRKAYAP